MRSFMKLILPILFFISFTNASEVLKSGTVSIFVLKNGKPLANNEIIIDGTKKFRSDSDGWAQTKLPVGTHQLQIFGKEPNGLNLGYIKKPFKVKRDRDTQIIASFTADDTLKAWSIDTPVGKVDDNNTTKVKSTGRGTISGIVLISQSKKPIAGARVFVKGTDIDARTDNNGRFSVVVPSGNNLSISVVHSAYSAQTINDIIVAKDASVSKTIELTPASMELEEFIVLAPKVQGSIASVMAEEKESSSIANILGSEELSKKGDSSAAGALKRVTGITLVGGKSIFVRGLGDRYSNIEMNSLPLPSPDPTKRVVPLDIFPAGVIGSLKVQKSASADIPSSFGGGYINIRTKDKSDKNYVKVSAGISASSETGSDIDTYQGGGSDWSGFDDGYRDIPSQLLSATEVYVGQRVKSSTTDYFSKEQLSQFTQSYANRDYSVVKEKMPIGFGTSFEAAHNYDLNDDHKFSLFANYGYSQKHKFSQESFFGYDMRDNGSLDPIASKAGRNRKSATIYNHGGILNLGYAYKDNLNLKYTKLYTLSTKDSTRVISGTMGSNYDDLTKYYLEWEERILNVDQLSGKYEYELFDHFSNFLFGLEHAAANLNQPNNFEYTYITDDDGSTHIDSTQSNFVANNLASDDTMIALYLKNRTYLDLYTEDDYVELGININTKERISRQRKYYLRPIGGKAPSDSELTGNVESILDDYVRADINYDDRGFMASPLFLPADYFDANVDEFSTYLSSLIKPRDYLEVMAGVKYVDVTQTLYQYEEDRTNPDMSLRKLIQKIPEELLINDFYPSMSLKYKYNDDNHFDIALSKTYIIPDLREFTSGLYFHPYDVATVMGNPELVNTDIFNLDLKYSYYISAKENIKFGLFYKYLDKPIEDVMKPSTSLPLYSFDNADSATLYGIEIDGRKNLGILKEGLENYYISGNISFTDSDVTLREEQEESYSTNHRQLQGLSQVVVNATFGYDSKKRSFAISYNKMGERIRKVGLVDAGDKFPDNIEIPPTLLDLVWSENLNNGIKVTFKAKNLLDSETVWKQGDLDTKRFKTGMAFSLSGAYKFVY